jgi:hypothetical protein
MAKNLEKISYSLEALPPNSLSPNELRLVEELVRANDKSARELIPDPIAPNDLWSTLSAACKVLAKTEEAKTRLKPLIGRMLILIERKPELYQTQGFSNFNDFMTNGVWKLYRISRAEAYNMKKIAEELGNISTDVITEIGVSKANLVASALRRQITDGTPREIADRKQKDWLEKARHASYDELKLMVYDSNLAEKGELDHSTIIIESTKDVATRWKSFRRDPAIKGISETDQPGVLLNRMMDECESTWKPQFQDQIRHREE